MSEQLIYIDGQFLPRAQAKVSVYDHGFLYGDGVFEGIRFYQRNIFRMAQHMERLYSSSRVIAMEIPIPVEDMVAATQETCRRSGLEDGYIRLVVSRGEGDLGIAPWLSKRASVIIIVDKINLYDPKFYTEGLAIITASTRRNAPDSLSPRIKSLNYLNNVMAKIEARNAGVFEALMLNHQGFVVEATADNVFIVKNGAVCTPPIWHGPLRGVTRDTILEMARQSGIPAREEPITLFEVYDAHEVFLTGTAAEVVPVRMVDGRPIGSGKPGAMTALLRDKFRAITATDGVKF